MLDPEFFFDEELATVKDSAYVRLFYEGLWCHCDDNYHTVPNSPGWLKAQIFPYEEVDVSAFWKTLVKTGKLVEFESGGKSWGWLKNFGKHQRIEKPSISKYPEYPDTPVVVGEESGSPPAKVKRSKEKLSKENSELFDRVWKEYPKKVGKEEARSAFSKLEPSELLVSQIISALALCKKTSQWQDSDGRYIPHFSTWLKQKRHLDIEEIETSGPKIVGWEQTSKGARPIYEPNPAQTTADRQAS